MKIYVRVCDGLVQELFTTDGDITQMFHPDIVWADVTSVTPQPKEGWSAMESDQHWSFMEPELVPPSDEELKSAVLAQRDALLKIANDATAGMADAYIAGLLSPSDAKTFEAFAAYKLLLNKIPEQESFPREIQWPVLPV